ncbi:Solute-binding protein [subsurface metagenome]
MLLGQPLNLPSALVSGKVGWQLYQEFPEIQAEYAEVKTLFFYSTSAYQLHTVDKPLNTLEDLKGMLVRCGGPVDTAIAEALGAIPQFLSMPDAYLALEKGVLDAHMGPYGPMKGFGLADVTYCHLTNANLHTCVFCVIMNLDTSVVPSLANYFVASLTRLTNPPSST